MDKLIACGMVAYSAVFLAIIVADAIRDYRRLRLR